ncbi:MAG: hypothetical protein M3Y09_15990 [Actinomycetota bacterium]|nr:hypothetical protein [Actinomycetota bacterium]
MLRKILVGADDRLGDREAIALARQLAAPEAQFELAHVYAGHCTVGGEPRAKPMSSVAAQ